jgi:hypothetical protein
MSPETAGLLALLLAGLAGWPLRRFIIGVLDPTYERKTSWRDAVLIIVMLCAVGLALWLWSS